jgi:hypothetical protein
MNIPSSGSPSKLTLTHSNQQRPSSSIEDEELSYRRVSSAAIRSLLGVTTSSEIPSKQISEGKPLSQGTSRAEKRGLTVEDAPPSQEVFALKRRTKDNYQPKTNPDWFKKSPDLVLDSITINGIRLEIEELGVGEYHKAYKFSQPSQIVIGDNRYPTDQVILKILNSIRIVAGSKKERQAIEDEMKSYQKLISRGVPVALIYVNPMNFQDAVNPKNGKFWIVEKMTTPITGAGWKGTAPFESLKAPDQAILTWAAHWLTQMAITGEDIINDFRKRNTMLDSTGSLRVIDFSLPETEEVWDIKNNLSRYVLDWSNKNTKIIEFLTANFPPDLQASIRNTLTAEIESELKKLKVVQNVLNKHQDK